MRVFFITTEPFPEGYAATNRIICLAKAYQTAGVICQVLIFSSNMVAPNIKSEGVVDGVPYKYLNETTSKKSLVRKVSSIKARLNLFNFLRKGLSPGDYVYGYFHQSNLFSSVVIPLTHRSGAFFISELCELPYGTGHENKKKKRQRRYALKHIFPRYDGVVAISETLKDLATVCCNPKCVVIKVPILVDFSQYNLPDKSEEASYPYIFHSGTLYEQKDGVLGMLEAFGLAMKNLYSDTKFVMTGSLDNAPNKKELEAVINKYHLQDKIVFTGYLTKESLKDYLAKAVMVIINKYPSQQNEYCFSTKLGEYLAAGKPLIITKVGEAVRWLNHNENAFIVEPHDIGAMSHAIVFLLNEARARRDLGTKARELCEQSFHYANYGQALLNQLNKIQNN